MASWSGFYATFPIAKCSPIVANKHQDISESSKIHYNVAMIYMHLDKPNEAVGSRLGVK
jgi:hypothetical protein